MLEKKGPLMKRVVASRAAAARPPFTGLTESASRRSIQVRTRRSSNLLGLSMWCHVRTMLAHNAKKTYQNRISSEPPPANKLERLSTRPHEPESMSTSPPNSTTSGELCIDHARGLSSKETSYAGTHALVSVYSSSQFCMIIH